MTEKPAGDLIADVPSPKRAGSNACADRLVNATGVRVALPLAHTLQDAFRLPCGINLL